jgi:hypothetical protein
MKKKRFRPLDLAKVKTYPLKRRLSKVRHDLMGKKVVTGMSVRSLVSGLPNILAAENLKEIARKLAKTHRAGRTVALAMGAHPLKVGLSPLIVDFMERGIISAVAMNGAGIIHDFELASTGRTSEDVAASLKDGSFGMAEETGKFLNEAIATGHHRGLGIGRAVGEAIHRAKFPYERLSILAAGVRLGVPLTVHVGIGTDIIHMHPEADGKAIGEGSLRDFHALSAVAATLRDGVFINLGSAVILPEVFLKALNLARNTGHRVDRLTTVNIDFLPHYRPLTNVIARPTLDSGKGYHLTGHMEIMVPLLFAAVLEEL